MNIIIGIFISVSIGHLLSYFDFTLVLLFISENLLVPFLLFIISYMLCSISYLVSEFSVNLIDRINISFKQELYSGSGAGFNSDRNGP